MNSRGCKKFLFLFFLVPLFASVVSAHCPLCVMGAGAAAAGAVWLGVSKVVVALFIGAFAMSMGMWFARVVKKKYIPFQKTLIVLAIFLTTVLPLLPIFKAIGPLYLSFIGEYGATFAVNYSLYTSILGGLIVFIAPSISRKISITRGKTMPFQGVLITFIMLIIGGVLLQILI